MVATGALSFGAGILVNELFNDDDDDWGDHVDWDDHRVYGGGGKDINVGDVNIDKSVNVDGGAWKPNQKQKADAKKRLKQKKAKLDGGTPAKQRPGDRGAKKVSGVEKKLAARGHDRESVKRKAGAPAKIKKASGNRGGAFEGKKSAPKVKKERSRGAASVRKSKGGSAEAKSVKKASKVPKGAKREKASKPHKTKTAFSGGSGKSAKAAKKRGHKSTKAKKDRRKK